MILDRTRQLPDGKYYPSVDLYVRGWNMTGDVTEDGSYRL